MVANFNQDDEGAMELHVLTCRIVRLGYITNPGSIIIHMLSPFDLKAIRDAAIAQDEAIEEKLNKNDKKSVNHNEPNPYAINMAFYHISATPLLWVCHGVRF